MKVKATRGMKKKYIKKAMELCYDPSIIKAIRACEYEEDITKVMITYRKRLP